MDNVHAPPPLLQPLLMPREGRVVLDSFAVLDSALSSEDGSGLHTPTITTPVSVLVSLPQAGNGIPPAKEPRPATVHSTPSLNNAYHDPGVPDNNPFLLRSAFPSLLDIDLPNNRRPRLPSHSSLHIQLSPLRRLSSNMHPSLPEPPPLVVPSSDARQPPPSDSKPPEDKQSEQQQQQQQPAPSASPANNHPSTAPMPRTSRTSSNMVIACRQCRARKIRCDSTRPTCHNCTRRSSTCEYDAAPKRRGPDKRPGTRTRTCKKKPSDEAHPPPNKRKRLDDSIDTTTKVINQPKIDTSASLLIHPSVSSPLSLHSHSPVVASSPSLSLYPAPLQQTSSGYQTTPVLNKTWPRTSESAKLNQADYSPYNHPPATSFNILPDTSFSLERKPVPTLINPPSTQYSRKAWWDDMLNNYTPNQSQAGSLQTIVNDLSFLFSTASYWLACFNVPVLLRNVCDPVERERIQPSLVLSALALATLMRSSEIGLGEQGRERALNLREAAQASMEASINSHWIEPSLAQAALILALFEASAHPKHTGHRAASSLMYLDSIIHTLALTRIDAHDPDTSIFPSRGVPAVARQPPPVGKQRCSCETSPLTVSSLYGNHATSSASWSCSPSWDPNWSAVEVQREESRRLCWSALTLVAAHTADCAAVSRKPLDLQLIKASNYALLFPGEILTRTEKVDPPHPPKESVWALYCRSMLLWTSCSELSHIEASDTEKAEFAVQAWMEADIIEEALNFHICSAEQSSLFVGRDYLLNTRITITQEFRRYVPLPTTGANPFISRRKAEDWLKYQQGVASRVKATLHLLTEGQGQVFASRPFYVWWFMGQIAISMSLWHYDPALIQALEICHEYLAPTDVLTYLWPCPVQRGRYLALRDKLAEASLAAGIPPPPPPNFALPSHPIL